MKKTFARETFDALLPKGAVWELVPEGNYDKLLDALSENKQILIDELSRLGDIRNPYRCKTGTLTDLEKEYGIVLYSVRTEQERRASLAAVRFKKPSLPVAEKLQSLLDEAGLGQGGYGLEVTLNTPPVNPDEYLQPKAYYLYSASLIKLTPIFLQFGEICCRRADGSDSKSGRECMGFFTAFTLSTSVDDIDTPPEPYWPMIFFVSGPVERNEDGEIIKINYVSLPENRKKELHRLILRVKPMGTWAAVNVVWT